MDDLSSLRPILVMLLFRFIMGLIWIPIAWNCRQLKAGCLGGGVMKPSLFEDMSEKSDVFASTGGSISL